MDKILGLYVVTAEMTIILKLYIINYNIIFLVGGYEILSRKA